MQTRYSSEANLENSGRVLVKLNIDSAKNNE